DRGPIIPLAGCERAARARLPASRAGRRGSPSREEKYRLVPSSQDRQPAPVPRVFAGAPNGAGVGAGSAGAEAGTVAGAALPRADPVANRPEGDNPPGA